MSLTTANHGEDEKSLLLKAGVQMTSLSTLLSHHRHLFLYPNTLVISKQKSNSPFIRYLFLYPNALVISKEKGGGTFKTKEKIRIENVWVSCTGSSPDSFLIGWPLTNFLVHFPYRREKEEWFALLTSVISAKMKPLSTTIMMSILVRGRKQMIRRRIDNGRRAGEVIIDTQTELDLPSAGYDLRIQIGDSTKTLQGPENVYCVIMNELEKTGVRLSDSQRATLDTCPVVTSKLILSHLRTSRPSPQEMVKTASERWSSLKRRLSRSDSKSLFGRPIEGRTPPQPILSIIDHLRMHSCDTEGLFRKSPKQSKAKELRGELEKGLVPDYNKYNSHVLAAILKEYLRSIPSKLLLNGNFQLWMNDVVEQPEFAKKMCAARSLLSLLPAAHSILLVNLLRLLSKVASSVESLMTASSLAVCLAPSFLDCSDAESSKRVPELITFLIEHAAEVIPSFSSPSVFSLLSPVDLNSNELSPSLHIEECTSPTPDPLSPPSLPLFSSPLSPPSISSPLLFSPPPPHEETAPSTPIFRSKALRGENNLRDKKETPRSPCLKRIHFNAHLLKGGGPCRPSLLSDSDSDGEDYTWRPLSQSTVDVPRKTSLDSMRSDERSRLEGRNEQNKRHEASANRPEKKNEERTPLCRTDFRASLPECPPIIPPPPLPPRLLRDDKPTVQVLPFRAKEREDANGMEEDGRECKVNRSLSQRTTEQSRTVKGDILQRTSSVLSDRTRRPVAHRTEPICVGLDQLEINWSVAQLKRNFQSTKAPEIKTNFGE